MQSSNLDSFSGTKLEQNSAFKEYSGKVYFIIYMCFI